MAAARLCTSVAVLAALSAAALGYSTPSTPCLQASQQAQAGRRGQFLPRCDRSGAYAAQQCHGSRCFCVDRDGQQLRQYGAVGRHQTREVSCGCARQKADQAGRLGGQAVVCDERGNYAPRQCVGSTCHCVNVRTGSRQQRSGEVPVSQAATLNCGASADGGPYRTAGGAQVQVGGETPCWDARRQHEARAAGPLAADTPECDQLGRYQPKQCRHSQCFCVTPQGVPLQPYQAVPRSQQLHCGCARRSHEISESQLIGITLNCDRHGDYERQQCLGSVCHCADPVTGEKVEGGRSLPIHRLAELDCLQQQQGPTRPLLGGRTPCWDELKKHETSRRPLLGAEKPECDRIGRYHPKQCKGSQCQCVDPYGAPLGQYRRPRGESDNMFCNCARREWEIQRDGRLGRSVRCDSHGNFAEYQCIGSVCHCVESHSGDRVPDLEVSIGDLAQLDCGRHRQRLLGSDRPCDDKLRAMRAQLGGARPPPGYEEPGCQRDGRFQPLQCSGSVCYCAAPSGEKLQRYEQPRHQQDRMSCECARRAWEHSTNGLGRSVTCDQFGGFHHTQCEGSTCYCVDTTTGEPSGSPTVHVSQVSRLRCGGGADIVGDDTPCWDERRRREQQQQQSQYPLLGLEMPDCDLSGHHQPKQCSGSQCYCVDPAGRKLEPYTTARWQADDMLCVCARRESDISSQRLVGVSTSCDPLGNFKRRQCLGSQCFCVDPATGAQVDAATVHISQSHRLHCSGSGHSGGTGAGHSGGSGAGHSGGSGSGHSGGSRPPLLGSLPPVLSASEPVRGSASGGRQLLGADTPCWKERTEQTEGRATAALGASLPECDRSGKYAPKQCKGSKCSCVNPDGSVVPGFERNLWDAKEMHCNCVRRKYELQKGGLLGHSVTCNQLGNFHTHQCQGTSCYCVDHLTGERRPDSETVPVGESARLQQLCATMSASHPCWDERRALTDSGHRSLPQCDIFGQYAPKQCTGSQCQCVDKEKRPLPGFSVALSESAEMHCHCARQQAEIQSQRLLGRSLRCDRLGNYQQQQCTGSACYQVDPVTGERQQSQGGTCREAARRLAGSGRQPQCAGDGGYLARQCQRGSCFCVDSSGRRLPGFQSQPDQSVTCHCARRQQLVQSAGGRGLTVSCDARGDYQPSQCLGSTCYCVDVATGSRLRHVPERHISQLRELACQQPPASPNPGY